MFLFNFSVHLTYRKTRKAVVAVLYKLKMAMKVGYFIGF